MKPIRTALVVLVIVTTFAIPASQATVITAAWYKLGEDDPGAAANTTGQNPTQDSSVNNLDLNRLGSPINRADTAPLSRGSTLSMQFNGTSDGYFGPAPAAPGLSSNVGIEAWVKPALANDPNNGIIAFNGNGFNGYGLLQLGSNLGFYIGGAGSAAAIAPVTPGQWVHVALTIGPSNIETGYVNGVAVTTGNYGVIAPTTQLDLGAGGSFGSPTSFFNGEIDQVRVFSFTGAFSPADFLITPEPSTVMLLGMGGWLVRVRGRRRARIARLSVN